MQSSRITSISSDIICAHKDRKVEQECRRYAGDRAYAMRHAAAAAAGYRAWHGYRLAANSFYSPSAALGHWQWSSLLNVNDDQSAHRDKPLDGSRGIAP